MSEALLLLAAIVAGCLGFALFALSQPTQWRRLTARGLPGRRRIRQLRFAGLAALAASLTPLVVRDGAGFGILLWGVVTSAAAMAVAFSITALTGRRPRK